MKAKDIINQLLESKSIKAGSFAKEIGVHPTQIYDLQSEKTKKISASIASKIVNRYPEYDPIWLLTGEGTPLKSSPTYQIESENINIDLQENQIDSKGTIEVLIKVIETYQTRMDDLLNVVEVLKNENADLKEQLQKQKAS